MSSIYFLADGDAEAVRFVGHFEDLLRADHVLAHDMITVPHLTSLPDLAEGLPVTVDLSVITQIWPNMPEDPEGDLSWMAEPVVERISDPLRDRVAAIHTEQVPEGNCQDLWIGGSQAARDLVGALDELAVAEDRSGADEGDEVGAVDGAPAALG